MVASEELDDLALRVQQAYYEDGLADLLMGSILILAAAFVFLISVSAIFLVWMIIIFNPIFLQHLIEAAKRRWVYPRMGYVKPKPLQEGTKRDLIQGAILILSVFFGPIIVLLALFGFTGLVLWVIWIAPVSIGFLLGVGPFLAARKYRLRRYYLFAVLPLILGLVIPWVNLGFPNLYALFFTTIAIEAATVGILAFLSGALLFLRFIRRYPLEKTDVNESDSANEPF